jgi:hypothetical protein
MRFFCMMPVRDEGDVIGQCLGELLKWADAIYIFDTGSVDDTWDIIRDWAARDNRVKPLRRDFVYFSDACLRAWIFHHVRQDMRNGDWFLRVDADEFYHVPPPEFVKTRLRPHETIAWYQVYDFRLTESEVKAWEEGRETKVDRRRPIEERRRWFTPRFYTEPRLCRYRESMRWPASTSFPYSAGFLARERLPIRHYPHRDPAQLDRRCRLRAFMREDSAWIVDADHHWGSTEWRKFVAPDDLPELHYWQPGTDLTEVRWTNHLAPPPKRVVQRIVHAVGLPLLDALRPGWVEGTYPGKIPAEVVKRMERELAPNVEEVSRLCM